MMAEAQTTRKLLGQRALVTGAGKRIGRAIALALAAEGCDIALHYNTSKQSAEETAAEIGAYGRQVELFQADFRDEQAAGGLAHEVLERFAGLEILINNASVYPSRERRRGESDLNCETIDSWELSLAVNARAPFFLTQCLASALSADGDGKIVNILDLSASKPFISRASHTVSKAALASITKLSAKTLFPGVRVNAVELGAIIPPGEMPVEERAKIKRWGEVEDAVRTVMFLLKTDFINGEIVRVDGGELLLGQGREA